MQNVWLKSSENAVNLMKKILQFQRYRNYFLGDYYFLARPVQCDPVSGT